MFISEFQVEGLNIFRSETLRCINGIYDLFTLLGNLEIIFWFALNNGTNEWTSIWNFEEDGADIRSIALDSLSIL